MLFLLQIFSATGDLPTPIHYITVFWYPISSCLNFSENHSVFETKYSEGITNTVHRITVTYICTNPSKQSTKSQVYTDVPTQKSCCKRQFIFFQLAHTTPYFHLTTGVVFTKKYPTGWKPSTGSHWLNLRLSCLRVRPIQPSAWFPSTWTFFCAHNPRSPKASSQTSTPLTQLKVQTLILIQAKHWCPED